MLEGLTLDECATRYAETWTKHRLGDLLEPPGAEPRAEVEARMVRGMRKVIEAHAASAPVLVVSHGGAIRAFLAAIDGGLVPPMKNAECYFVRERDGSFAGYERFGG